MSNIRGYSPPNDTTVGAVGDIYTDIDDGVEYKCVGVHEVKSDTVTTYYSWVRVNTGSGSGGSVGGTDITLNVSGASVGQIAKIANINASGQPTAWEAVDMPSGGGGGARLISSVTVEEEVSAVSLPPPGR